MLSNLLTSSRLRLIRRCRREHRIKYELGYRPLVDSEELFFGDLIHTGLEAWWLAVMAALPVEEWLVRALAAMAGKADVFTLARAEVMISGYHFRWSGEASQYEVLGVEEQFETAVINPKTGAESRTWRLGGKLDVRLRERATSLLKFMEHKTSSEDVSPGTTYWRKLRMDGQVSVYFDGAASLGHEVSACIYDVLGKPQQRPSQVPKLNEHGEKVVIDKAGNRVRNKTGGGWRQSADSSQGYSVVTRPETIEEFKKRLILAVAENPDRFYARGEVVRLEQELDDARADIWAVAKELREDELAGRAPRNPDACERFGRMCSYFDVCTGAASLEDPRLFIRTTQVHPELAGVPEPATPKEVA